MEFILEFLIPVFILMSLAKKVEKSNMKKQFSSKGSSKSLYTTRTTNYNLNRNTGSTKFADYDSMQHNSHMGTFHKPTNSNRDLISVPDTSFFGYVMSGLRPPKWDDGHYSSKKSYSTKCSETTDNRHLC